MPRSARKQSESDVYHVISRGVNQSIIFEDDSDNERFLEMLREAFGREGVELYCWCLMGNHFHLLAHADSERLSAAMKSLLARYAIYFNTRHGRSGHLFQDRFRTEAVDTDEYLMTVVRYIHRNPVKAGLADSCDYRWSSYGEYHANVTGNVTGDGGLSHQYRPTGGACSTERVLEIFGGLGPFTKFHAADSDDQCLDVTAPKRRMGDAEAISFVESEFGHGAIGRIAGMPAEERNAILRRMKQAGISIRQAQRLTGVGKRIVERA